MKGNQRENINQRIDVEILAGVQRSGQKRGLSTSHMIELALSQFLSMDVEITAAERQNYKKKCIEASIDALSSVFEMELKGSLVSKIGTIMVLCSGFENIYPLRDSTKTAKMSLFEILIDLKDYDKGLFDEILPALKRFKKLYSMYTQTTL